MTNAIKRYLAQIGNKGGQSGRGDSKRRGDAEYYTRISGLAAEQRRAKARARREALEFAGNVGASTVTCLFWVAMFVGLAAIGGGC